MLINALGPTVLERYLNPAEAHHFRNRADLVYLGVWCVPQEPDSGDAYVYPASAGTARDRVQRLVVDPALTETHFHYWWSHSPVSLSVRLWQGHKHGA